MQQRRILCYNCDMNLAIFREDLKARGFSITVPRITVFIALHKSGLMSMGQLVDVCKSIDRASIYRAVDLFEKLHIIHKVYQGFKYKIELGEPYIPHHHHIRCTHCDASIDIGGTNLERVIQDLAHAQKYMLTSHIIELSGLCPMCKTL